MLTDVLEHVGDEHLETLEADQTDAYTLSLQAGEALLVEVDQMGVDVELEVFEPDHSKLLDWDTPTHRAAPERLCFVTTASGLHTLVVAPFSKGGRYTVRLLQRRQATEEDRLCFEASRIFQTAFSTNPQEDTDLEARIAEFEGAAVLWEQAQEPFLAALAWRESASLRRSFGPTAHAIETFGRALSQAREASNSYLEVSILNRLGITFLELGDLEQARVHLEQAEHRARETEDTWGLASALTNLGRLDDQEGQPHRALERLAKVLPLWREVGDPIELAQALQHMASSHGVLDDHDRALDLLAQALELTRQAGDEPREGNVLLDQGWIHYLRGRPSEGIPALERVLEIRRAHGDLVGEAVALDRLGTLLRESGDIQRAEETYLRSLEISIATEGEFDAAGTMANLGCLYADSGRLAAARDRLDDALELYQKFNDPRAVSHIEYCRALVGSAAGELSAALEHIGRALQIVDRLRDSARHRGHYYRPIWLWQEYAELEVALLLRRYKALEDRHDLERAFQTADLINARTLFEKVVETQVGVRSSADNSLLLAERSLQDELNQWAQKRSDGGVTDKVSPESEIRRLRAELERVRAAIRVADPRHGSVAPRPITVELAQQLLDPDTLLLSYILKDEEAYLILLGHSVLQAHELGSRRDLEAHAEAFYQALKRSHADPFQWRMIAAKLSRWLLPEAAISKTTKRLIVVPDGLLHYIPFAALTSPFNDQMPLVHDLQVSYAPSVSVLAQLRQRNRDRSWYPIAVFADPVYSRDDERLQSSLGRFGNRHKFDSPKIAPRYLPRLRYSAEEAEAIATLAESARTTVRLGFGASREALREMDLTRYGILHFATHAWIDERFPELSGLALSQFTPSGKPIDSDLRLHEIHGLKLDAELTVLSGCDTALGKLVEGNGLEGFAHGFLYAGSSRVLVSLWKVDDRATAKLMDEFYRVLLEEEVDPATALRAAQDWLRKQSQWEAPYYWAPFVLQGEN